MADSTFDAGTGPASIDFLANNGDMGGGEVMLLALAKAARELGLKVRVIGPSSPGELVEHAESAGFETLPIDARNRKSYFLSLARCAHHLQADLLWCNGLLPSLATAVGSHRRIVHLHQVPAGRQRHAARIATKKVAAVVVPSNYMTTEVPGARVLENWTEDFGDVSTIGHRDGVTRVGFIGRFSPIKGLDVLADAMGELQALDPGRFRLVLAGDARFVADADALRIENKLRGVDAVTRLGWTDRASFFSQVDLVVVPSVRAESFGLVAAEAMSAGIPVIVSDTGALPEVVGADYPWVVAPNDAARLADVIVTVAGKHELVSEHVRLARARWIKMFSPNAGKQRLNTLLMDLELSCQT